MNNEPTDLDKRRKEHPWLYRREWLKLMFTEWLAKWFKIHIEW